MALAHASRVARSSEHAWELELLDHVRLGDNHAFAHLRWTRRRPDGVAIQAFNTGYQLARTEHGPQVLMCTAYQEDLSNVKCHAPL
jgi:hypothetical protein